MRSVMFPTRFESGLTDDERERMKHHAQMWIERIMRTGPTDHAALTKAIKDLYAVSNLKEPRVVIVQSPLVMAVAGGLAEAWWDLCSRSGAKGGANYDTRACAYDAISGATYEAAGVTRVATTQAIYDATRATRDTTQAIYDATKAATIDVSHATRVSTNDAIRAATRDDIYSATYVSTYAATNYIKAATYDATYSAINGDPRAATLESYAATYGATLGSPRASDYVASHRAVTADAIVGATEDTIDSLGASSYALWIAELSKQVLGEFWREGIHDVHEWRRRYQGGNMWGRFESYLTAFRDVLGLRLPQHAAYDAWERAAIHGGFRYMHEKFCMVTEFPAVLKVDGDNRPHCEDGPSHRWNDGWSLYHWHGVRVPRIVIERPDQITIRMISEEENAEVRRVMMQRYGLDRYLNESGAIPVQSDVFGELYRIEGMQFPLVKVINSTPEPDGSRKVYVLTAARDDCETAHDAVASTFGLTADTYHPEIET